MAGNDLQVAKKTDVKKPRLYKVVMLNDDYTPMDFVVNILMGIFGKSHEEAESIMMAVHKDGAATAGVYTFEVAETKAYATMASAQSEGHPLQVTVEQE